MKTITRVNRERVYDGSVVEVYQDTMLLPSNETQKWDYIHRKVKAAAIVPVLDDGRIIMVKQFRSSLNRETLEIPAGAMEKEDSDSRVTAIRELKEETGFEFDEVEYLTTINPIAAYCDEVIDIYYAKNVVLQTDQVMDVGESITTSIMSMDELLLRIYSGEITDGKTVVGILAYYCRFVK